MPEVGYALREGAPASDALRGLKAGAKFSPSDKTIFRRTNKTTKPKRKEQ
jgi:hypothetical protein